MRDDLVPLRAVSELALKVDLPSLQRPPVPYGAAPTRQLVDFGISLYSYGAFCHFREMLQTFICVADAGMVPASFLVARVMFEMAAHTYYVQKHVGQYLKENDLRRAEKFLDEANTGSRYLQEQSVEIKKEYHVQYEFDAPVDVAKAIKCLDEYARKAGGKAGDSWQEYSFLSEFCHPNGAAFMHYYQVTPSGIRFQRPSRELDLVIPPVVMSTAEILQFIDCALRLAQEVSLRAAVKRCVDEFLRTHAAKKSTATL